MSKSESAPPARKGGLGRGLAALIPSGPDADAAAPVIPRRPVPARGGAPAPAPKAEPGGEVAGAVYREIGTSAIKPNPKQPRQVFDEDALAELEHSIREFGLMQPIVVRDLGGDSYELVMGERRLRASQQAELEKIPAIVRQRA